MNTQPVVNEYEQAAQGFLDRHAIQFKVTLIGSSCPPFCEDMEKGVNLDKVDSFPRKTHIHGKHYRCALERRTRREEDGQVFWGNPPSATLVIDFWNSYADEEWNALGCADYRRGVISFHKWGRGGRKRQVTPYDLLACLTKYDPGTFEDFCGELGYDSDSRKAEQTYQAVRSEWRKAREFFTAEELEELREIN